MSSLKLNEHYTMKQLQEYSIHSYIMEYAQRRDKDCYWSIYKANQRIATLKFTSEKFDDFKLVAIRDVVYHRDLEEITLNEERRVTPTTGNPRSAADLRISPARIPRPPL